jgi:hypothetical protein
MPAGLSIRRENFTSHWAALHAAGDVKYCDFVFHPARRQDGGAERLRCRPAGHRHARLIQEAEIGLSTRRLADEAFADVLRKHGRPTDLKTALRQSVAGMERPATSSVKRGGGRKTTAGNDNDR